MDASVSTPASSPLVARAKAAGMVVGFNLLAMGLTAAAAWVIRRRPERSPLLPPIAVGAALGVVARVVPDDRFLVLQLAAWAAFLWLPVGLFAGAGILRVRRPRTAAAFAAVGGVTLAVGGWAFLVEPTRLQITTVHVVSDKVATPFTIAVVSDLQTDRIGRYETMVMALVAESEAELILWPGDYVQGDRAVRAAIGPRFNALVRAADIDGPMGHYAVQGNVDAPGWERLFDGTGAIPTSTTRSWDNGVLRVTALSLDDSFDTDLVVAPTDDFHVVFGHAPDFALGDVDADLLIAGHTHGGQVRVPGFGPLITLSAVPRAWAAGRTDLEGGRTLVVSRGLGMERDNAPRLRLFCRPELVFVQVGPAPVR